MINLDIKKIILNEFQYFETNESINSFKTIMIDPYKIIKKWGYSNDLHECWTIAEVKNKVDQIIYCQTGFGPSFPWGIQNADCNDLGMDDVWFAYLYEAFMCSNLCTLIKPKGFELMGPNERCKINNQF